MGRTSISPFAAFSKLHGSVLNLNPESGSACDVQPLNATDGRVEVSVNPVVPIARLRIAQKAGGFGTWR
jgi:hypothetical protein